MGQVPEVAVRPVGEGRPGQAQLQWAGGLVRRAWQLAPMGLMGLVSWTVWLVRRLLSVRYQPTYDPVAGDQAVDLLPEMKLAPEPLDAVEGAHALVVMTGWPELAELDPVVARERMAYPIMVDARNALDAEAFGRAGFTVIGVGRPVRNALTPAWR